MRRFLCIAVLCIAIASPATAVVNSEIDRSDLSHGRMSGLSVRSIAYESMFGSVVNVVPKRTKPAMHVPTAFGPHYVPGGLALDLHYVPGEDHSNGFGPIYEPNGFGPIYEPNGFGPIYEPNG